MAKDYPVGKAQQIVLDALGMTASGFNDAKTKFEQLGIVVGSKRVGRNSVPSITIKDRCAGGFTTDGDGVEWREYDDIDLAPINQWID